MNTREVLKKNRSEFPPAGGSERFVYPPLSASQAWPEAEIIFYNRKWRFGK